MHKNSDINLRNISKIEGHAGLNVKIRGGEVEHVKLKIVENMRFFTEAAQGRRFNSVHQLVSRICGTCSTAHLMGCIECIEHTFNLPLSDQTKALKHLTMNGMQIRDHAMHLFFFCLPDLFGRDSVLDFKSDYEKKLLHDALHIKEVGNQIGKLVAGRAIHPTLPTVGGFIHAPKKEQMKELISLLKAEREKIAQFIDLFYEWDKSLDRKTNYIATHGSGRYNFWEGNIMDSKGICIPDFAFTDYLKRVIIPYSQAEGFLYKGETYMVGALARMNMGKQTLHKDTKKDAQKCLSLFPSNNIYRNNLAQAIEIMHAFDHSLELLEGAEFADEKPVKFEPAIAGGTGVVEAPRGTLYYYIEFRKGGIVDKVNIIIPTAQNQIMMEKDCGRLVQHCIEEGKEKDEIERELEMLIRAYDPCMSCATHFLEVDWQ